MTVDFPVTTHSTMLPVDFTPPPLPPLPFGLYSATTWQDEPGPTRYLNGVQVREAGNYGGADASGVWGAPWCGVPPMNTTPRKEGDRPDILDPFDPMVVWAADQCDLTEPSRAEVEARAAHILELQEQVAVERQFADRLKMDADDLPGALPTRANLRQAICYLEGAAAKTNTRGYIHLGAQWQSAEVGLFSSNGTTTVTAGGHTVIFGGGYVDGLEDTIVATSQPFGWRNDPAVRTAIDTENNIFAAVAERTVVVGYEALIAAVEIG